MEYVILVVAFFLFGESTKPPPPAGPAKEGIDWRAQLIRARGGGPPDFNAANAAQAKGAAERVAMAAAKVSLGAQVRALPVDARRTVGSLFEADSQPLAAALAKARVAGKRYYTDDGVEIELELPVGALTELLGPAPGGLDGGADSRPGSAAAEERTTGLVVDARGLGFSAVLSPRIIGGDGHCFYSVDSLSDDARKVSAVAAYVHSLDEAKETAQAGDRPLVVKAQKARGGDLELRPDDAKKLLGQPLRFLAQGKVVIVRSE